jgi:hypothetical protein
MKIDPEKLAEIPALIRCEVYDGDAMAAHTIELTHTVYPHQQQYGQYCSIQEYIDCPPDLLFQYMASVHSLSEWTYSVRDFQPTATPELYEGKDSLDSDTKIFCKVIANEQARTVDYHCAWDQGADLWMIYLYRIVPAELVFKRPGSVVFWSNCRHPYYDHNPYPERAPRADRTWVGQWWDFFYGGHTIELRNLKAIAEHRYRNRQPLGPHLVGEGA